MAADRAPLILASASPRRLALLAQVGITPDETLAPEVDETPLRGEMPRSCALRLAEAKARVALRPGAYVLAGDTVVARGRRVLDKPADADAARAHMALLSGRRHHVWGGIALVCPSGRVFTRVVDTVVRFKRLSAHEIERYIQSGEWAGVAGAYAIQGRAGAFVAAVNGSPTNVVGLCVHTTCKMLEGAGYPCA
ncbi:MAG TPA: septum formation protein Maf [Rhodospirillaceae bacterium]|jgi:septum formation protein|nr:septum formation protein Maf [Alphaproteobacteria bacterium]HBH26926.1 septum formation protein Maf [Rhodospirillaceae bacterium]